TKTAADGTPPAVIDAVTADTNANGRIDQIAVKFSELIQHNLETGGGAVGASGFPTSRVGEALADTLILELNDSSGGSNTGVKPTVVTNSTGNPVSDGAGNVLGASSFTGTRDGAAPAMMSARTRDNDADGRIDVILASFSEPVKYTATASPAFSSSTVELGTFSSMATFNGSTISAVVNEIAAPATNTNLPSVSPPIALPIQYTKPLVGGVEDLVGNLASDRLVNASDGAGPAITYAETADGNGDGRIDGMRLGFSEPIDELLGNPFEIAGGVRKVIDDQNDPDDGTELLTGGAPGEPLYGGVYVPLYALTTDGQTDGPLADPDGADRPTVGYVAHSGAPPRAKFAEDAANNEVIVTGSQSFNATLDKVRPILISLQAQDVNANGHVDQMRSVWSEPVATNGSPQFAALAASNGPDVGYTEPAIGTGATASGFAIDVPLTESAGADRDLRFTTQYTPSGPSDDGVTDTAVSPNNSQTSPAGPIETVALCADSAERQSLGQDDTETDANTTGLATLNGEFLGTLCGADPDFFRFTASAGETVKVLLAPSTDAIAARAADGALYNPFSASGPDGAITVTSSFDPDVGWIGEFVGTSNGLYRVGVQDTSSPLLDYGYCVSRTGDGSSPSCAVSQGDLIITEVLREVNLNAPTIGPFVEVRNVSGATVDIDGSLDLVIQGQRCTVEPHDLNTVESIPDGGYFYISEVPDSNKANDFDCPGMTSINYTQPISISSPSGDIDSVEFGAINVPRASTVQLRSSPQ
ncbi:MAG: hypothetical protein WAP35_10835, partial [Solirubrobacterales bacterium]